jgi:hypothetical protein
MHAFSFFITLENDSFLFTVLAWMIDELIIAVGWNNNDTQRFVALRRFIVSPYI